MYSNIKISKIIKAVSLMCALLTLLFSVSCGDVENENTPSNETEVETSNQGKIKYNTAKFGNPISPNDTPDPFITYDAETGYYYALHTQVDRIELYRHKHAADVFTEGERKELCRANGENDIWGDVWAPEMHRAPDGKWYVYSSSRIAEEDSGKQLFVLGSLTSDPFGEWEFKGRPTSNIFSIDPTIYTADDGTQYMCYSKYDSRYGQVLEIAKMKNPYTCESGVMIARAELEWELVEPCVGTQAIIEGAFFLESGDRLFLIYSVNGFWTVHYALGVLEYIGGDLCSPESWKKHPEPLLSYGNGVYGPGHASFFHSPDGTEVWCAYHGMRNPNKTVDYVPRYCHLQKVEFDESGYPIMGKPVGYGKATPPPSGEIK